VLLVHTSFSKVRPVEGGTQGLIVALQAALGPNGALVMPGMTDDDEHSSILEGRPASGWESWPTRSGERRVRCGVIARTLLRLSDRKPSA